MKAIWKNKVIAESDDTVVVEGNHYFPTHAVNASLLRETNKTTYCPWKGTANYYTLTVEGSENENAAWYYAKPKDEASSIAGHVAFWRGVQITD